MTNIEKLKFLAKLWISMFGIIIIFSAALSEPQSYINVLGFIGLIAGLSYVILLFLGGQR